MTLGYYRNNIKGYMKEIIINILGLFLLVYMVLAAAIFVVVMGVVYGIVIVISTILDFLSSMVKGRGISIRRGGV